jgi:hypothetical protein
MEIEFFWVISQIVISIVIIASIHYIYNFFKQNLTVPKIKDLVKKPEQQYKNIYNSLSQSKKEKEEKKINMKSELKNYINQLSKNKNQTTTIQKQPEILSNNMFQNSNNYSNF